MHPAGTTGHHARWWPGCGAFLEAGAAIRTLVARLVTETEGILDRATTRADVEPRRGAAGRNARSEPHQVKSNPQRKEAP